MTTLKPAVASFLLLMIWSCDAHLQRTALPNDKELFAEAGKANVKVLVSIFPKSQPCKAASSWRWGAENTCPNTFISAIEIKVTNKAVFVPFSAFADLGNPRTLRIEPRNEKGSFAVVLTGGDAATSYLATLEFRNGLLTEREVHHGEFPSEAWEKTFYKFNIGEN